MILLSANKVWLWVLRDGGIWSFLTWTRSHLSLHRHQDTSLEVVEETLLSLQENLFDLLLELGGPVSRWMFSGLNAALPTGPSASRITFSVTTITDGNARIGGRSTFPALSLAWLYIESSPCGGVRPAADPVDSDPGAVFEDDLHPRPDAGRPLEPWVCHHTREPTVLSRVSCRPLHLNFDRFHQPCLLHGAHFQDRWGLSSPYHVAATYPYWSNPALPPLRLTGGFCHADKTVPRQDVNSSFTYCGATLLDRCLHTRRFVTLASPPPVGDSISLAISSNTFFLLSSTEKWIFHLFGRFYVLCIESFWVDFCCAHRFQLLNVCNQHVTLPILPA